MNENVLIIDDEAEVRSLIAGVLSDEGYHTQEASCENEAFAIAKKRVPDLIFLDLWIGDDESAGMKILEKLKKIYFEIPVVIISGHGNIDVAVKAIQLGAFDFIEKPFVIDRLLLTCKRATEMLHLKKENTTLKNNRLDSEIFSVGNSSFATGIKANIEKIAPLNSRILIRTPSGVSADALALSIHKKSLRKDYRFVCLNCFPGGDLIENELFGTEKAYGYLEHAHGGTIFLEDIAHLSSESQKKLLFFLQEGKYLVGNRSVHSDVRVICSSVNGSVSEKIETGEFSQELFYRLSIVDIEIPPLCDRREDIVPIIDYYMSRSEQFFGLSSKKFSANSLAILQSYGWPGNLQQIKNVVESSLINSSSSNSPEIEEKFLPPELTSSAKEKFDSLNIAKFISMPLREAKEAFESDYLRAQIDRFSGNVSQTANFIGMERSALHRKLKNLNVKAVRKKSKDPKQ